MRRVPEGAELVPFILIVGLVFAALNPDFLRPASLYTIAASMAFVGIVAIGQTVVIITGNIDLSVGAVAALCAVVGAKLMVAGCPLVLAIGASLLLGALVGIFNAALTVLGIPSFVVTVGTLYMAGGIAVFITKGQPVFPLPPAVTELGTARIGQFTAPFLIMIVLLLLVGFVLQLTRSGRSVYAVGGDPQVATIAGISTPKVLFASFAFCGLTAGMAGLCQMAALAAASNTIGTGWELTSIAAVVIGGTSIFGGRGTVQGTFLGLLLLGVIANGLVSTGVEPNWQTLAVGAIMIAAIAFDFLRRRIGFMRSATENSVSVSATAQQPSS